MKKTIKMILVSAMCLLLICGTVHGESAAAYPLGLSLGSSADHESAMSFEADIRRQSEQLASPKGGVPESIPYDEAVQVFFTDKLGSYSDIEAARAGGEYLWRIPIKAGSMRIVSSLRAVDGSLTGCSSEGGTEESMKQSAYLFDRSLVEKAISAGGLVPEDTVVCTVPSVFVDYISFMSEGSAYVIPFASRPDFWRLENGRVYSLSEFITELDKLSSASDPMTGGGASGGVSPLWFVICGTVALIIIALVILLIRKRAASK